MTGRFSTFDVAAAAIRDLGVTLGCGGGGGDGAREVTRGVERDAVGAGRGVAL